LAHIAGPHERLLRVESPDGEIQSTGKRDPQQTRKEQDACEGNDPPESDGRSENKKPQDEDLREREPR
jgi:hypothetical protein